MGQRVFVELARDAVARALPELRAPEQAEALLLVARHARARPRLHTSFAAEHWAALLVELASGAPPRPPSYSSPYHLPYCTPLTDPCAPCAPPRPAASRAPTRSVGLRAGATAALRSALEPEAMRGEGAAGGRKYQGLQGRGGGGVGAAALIVRVLAEACAHWGAAEAACSAGAAELLGMVAARGLAPAGADAGAAGEGGECAGRVAVAGAVDALAALGRWGGAVGARAAEALFGVVVGRAALAAGAGLWAAVEARALDVVAKAPTPALAARQRQLLRSTAALRAPRRAPRRAHRP